MTRNSKFATSLKIGSALAALTVAKPLYAQDAAAQADPLAAQPGEGGETIVTARRRGEALQDVPIAVTALDGETLEDQGAVDLTAVMQRAPNTTLQIARGSNSTLIGFIRGVGQQDPLWGFEPGVGLYIDDVYIARPQAAVLDIFDVERIEVLRGPQGTLYGRNTIGGAVKYVTRRLGNEFTGRVRGSYGSYDQMDLVGAVTIPVGDTFAIGASGAWLQRDGYGTNLNTGREHYNKDIIAARVSAEFEPTPELTFRLAADWIRDRSNARHGHREVGNGGAAAFQPLANVYDTRAGAGDENEVETRGVSLTGEWRVADRLTLKSITAYRDGETNGNIDFDNTPGAVLDIPAFYADHQFSQEVQLVYEGERLQGVAGLYYLDGHARGAFDTVLGLANLTIFTTGEVNTRSLAGFADFSYSFSDMWRLSLGARYTSDRREGTVYRQNYTGVRSPFFGNAAAIPGLVRTNYTNTRTDEQFTPRVSISVLPTPDVTLYAAYSRGFKSGGFDMRGDAFLTPQTVNGYEPETVDTYEAGFKAYALDRALYFGIAAFYADYRNQQITTQVVAPGPSVASFVDNVGDSRIYGVELEARATVSPNISVAGMVGWINAKFNSFLTYDLATAQFIDVANQRVFQNTPEFQFMVAPTFSHELAGGRISFTPSISYRSDYSQFEIPNALLDENGYTLIDASIVWTSPNERFQLSAVARNLTDARYRIGGYSFPGALFGNSIIAFYGPPRTYTISAEMRF
jgi:iron complex outermembrane receptor protein